MSVLKTAYATPSRVAAVYRFLLQQGPGIKRETVQAVLSPGTLPDVETHGMVSAAIDESVRMGLIREDGDRLELDPDLPAGARSKRTGAERLPLTITDLVLRGNGENHDLARLIAWYLAQDIGSAPGDWDSASPVVGAQAGSDKLELTNDARYGQFKYWFSFLGFGWMHARAGKEWLVPDPTEQLRWRLEDVFRGDTRISPAQGSQRLAECCPVFEGGPFRREIEDRIGQRADRTLSSTTAHAWLRLDEERVVEVERRSADAEVYLFPDGEQTLRCSALVRGGNSAGRGR